MQIKHWTFSYAERRSKDYQSVEAKEGIECDLDEPWEWVADAQEAREELIRRVRVTATEALKTLLEEDK